MSLSNENGMVMPVSPLGNYGGTGFSGFGGDGWWVILFLFAMMGGWGNGFGGFGGGNEMFPYFFNTQTQNDVNRGFDNAGVASQLSGIQNAINNGFATAEVAGCNRAMDAMQTAYQNQIASMNQNFAMQQAFDQCCCENRLGIANLNSTILSENCADRAAVSEALRDVIAANTASTQRILDQMCQDKIDAKNEQIQNLQTQLNMANLAASQANQTAELKSDNTAQTQTLIQRIAPYPVPAYNVGYGYNYGNNYGFNPFGNVGFGNGSF